VVVVSYSNMVVEETFLEVVVNYNSMVEEETF
jgi:hypothetical protein